MSEKHLDELWKRMSRLYGHKWTSGFGETDDGTWLTGLRDLTPQQLATGLHACIERDDSWPPTLPEFRKLCTNHDPLAHDPLAHDPARIAARLPYLPAKVETPEQVAERIEQAEPQLAKAWAALGRT